MIKTLKVKELNIEIEKEIHDKGKSWSEINKLIPKGWRKITKDEIIYCFNNKKLRKELHLEDTWEFMESYIKDFPVSRFGADSGWASLGCVVVSGSSGDGLGVRFVRDLK